MLKKGVEDPQDVSTMSNSQASKESGLGVRRQESKTHNTSTMLISISQASKRNQDWVCSKR